MSCSRNPNSSSGASGRLMPARAGDLDPVGGHPFGVLARVRVPGLDGVGQGANGGPVGARQLLGAGALLLEGFAQVLGIQRSAGPPWPPPRACSWPSSARSCSSSAFRSSCSSVSSVFCLRAPSATLLALVSSVSPRRAGSSACAASWTGTTSIPSLTIPEGVGVAPIREQDHRASKAPSAQVECLQGGLRIADSHVDQRHLEAPLVAHPGCRSPARLPLVLDPELVERRLERELHVLAADDQHAAAARPGRRPRARCAARRRRSAWRRPIRPTARSGPRTPTRTRSAWLEAPGRRGSGATARNRPCPASACPASWRRSARRAGRPSPACRCARSLPRPPAARAGRDQLRHLCARHRRPAPCAPGSARVTSSPGRRPPRG